MVQCVVRTDNNTRRTMIMNKTINFILKHYYYLYCLVAFLGGAQIIPSFRISYILFGSLALIELSLKNKYYGTIKKSDFIPLIITLVLCIQVEFVYRLP